MNPLGPRPLGQVHPEIISQKHLYAQYRSSIGQQLLTPDRPVPRDVLEALASRGDEGHHRLQLGADLLALVGLAGLAEHSRPIRLTV